MTAYAKDPRVTSPTTVADLFHVALGPDDGATTAVVRRFLNGDTWVAWPSDEGDIDGWQEFPTADEAIRSLIGDPQ